MKTKFLLILLILIFATNGEAHLIKDAHVNSTTKEIELSAAKAEIEGRSINDEINIPARAFLNNYFVNIYFSEIASNVTVVVKNFKNNQNVYSQTYSNPANISINLAGEVATEYKLEMIIDGFIVVGYFNL